LTIIASALARELFVIQYLEDLCVSSSTEAGIFFFRADNIKSLRDSQAKSVDKIAGVPI